MIKSCPFCGGKAELKEYADNDGNIVYKQYYIECVRCKARSITLTKYYNISENPEKDVIVNWNKRVSNLPRRIILTESQFNEFSKYQATATIIDDMLVEIVTEEEFSKFKLNQ